MAAVKYQVVNLVHFAFVNEGIMSPVPGFFVRNYI